MISPAPRSGHWQVSSKSNKRTVLSTFRNLLLLTASLFLVFISEKCMPRPVSATGEAAASSKCCDEIPGFDLSAGRSDKVCGGSSVPACSDPASFDRADASCKAYGARLCTAEELRGGETSGTGCSLDDQLVWTSTSCVHPTGLPSRLVSPGAGSGSAGEVALHCALEASSLPWRCCADVCEAQQSHLPCSQLKNFQQASSRGPGMAVCGGSKVPACLSAITFDEAASACRSYGARLCTVLELQSNVTQGSGCGLDKKPIWTSTKCTATGKSGHYIARGGDGLGKQCEADSARLHVGCCGDEPAPRPKSYVSCDALSNFKDPTHRGSEAVCAGSMVPTCFRNHTHEGAETACLSHGARLCTIQELAAGETSGSGCGFDTSQVWTSTPCMLNGQAGHFAAEGLAGLRRKCRTGAAKGATSCCADVAVPETSYLACSSLENFTDRRLQGSNATCGGSQVPGCFYSKSFETATAICRAHGARLCSARELAAGETAGTGCFMDGMEVWTSTPCMASGKRGHITAKGETGLSRSCDLDSNERATRCCADQPLSEHEVSSKCCEDLTSFRTSTGSDVCGASLVPTCFSGLAFSDAEKVCRDHGARLCAIQELVARVPAGTGCGLDDRFVWSATRCMANGSPGHYAALGRNGWPRDCMADNVKHAVRCCADACTTIPTSAPTPSPTTAPTPSPTTAPTPSPTTAPTPFPTASPTPALTAAPTTAPTPSPTTAPTPSPTTAPTPSPTTAPTPFPTASPTTAPTPSPTTAPTPFPTASPTPASTAAPTTAPTPSPTRAPTPFPTAEPPTMPPIPEEPYTKYVGIKCKDPSIDNGRTDSVEDCMEWCERTKDCVGFSFRFTSDRCYLKKRCNNREADKEYNTFILKYHDIDGLGAGPLVCPDDDDEPCSPDGPDEECPAWSEGSGESSDPLPGTFQSPYMDIVDGQRTFVTTHPEVRDWPKCRFRAPTGPRPRDWADECIENARKVGFLDQIKGRPNQECPAGWFLCKGMCYTLVQRNSRGPQRDSDFYSPDYMSMEARCGLCGGARVAFVGDEDQEMQRVALEAARQTLNEDKAVWVRRFRFLDRPNPNVESWTTPYQPWHRFVLMHEDIDDLDSSDAAAGMSTYQRYYTGEKDGGPPGWDAIRNVEGSILCANTLPRIRAALRTVNSRLTMDGGCDGDDNSSMWDSDKHRWWPEHNWPFPGL